MLVSWVKLINLCLLLNVYDKPLQLVYIHVWGPVYVNESNVVLLYFFSGAYSKYT